MRLFLQLLSLSEYFFIFVGKKMETEPQNPKYVGYGYHGGGRKKKENKKVFVSTTISGSAEEIELLKRTAKENKKSVSRLVLDWIISMH